MICNGNRLIPFLIPNCIQHFYFMILQRYNYIRTSEALKRYNDLKKRREQNTKNNQIKQSKEKQEYLSLKIKENREVEEIKKNLKILREALLSCKANQTEFDEMVDFNVMESEVQKQELSLIFQKR